MLLWDHETALLMPYFFSERHVVIGFIGATRVALLDWSLNVPQPGDFFI
jgi:hypothetical protein